MRIVSWYQYVKLCMVLSLHWALFNKTFVEFEKILQSLTTTPLIEYLLLLPVALGTILVTYIFNLMDISLMYGTFFVAGSKSKILG